MNKPQVKPLNPRFSSGPANKYPNFSLSNINVDLLGRSHRSTEATIFFKELIEKTKALFQIPQDYKIIIAPGSDTGAIEIALWNLIGKLPVDCLCWDAFGYMWQHNLEKELKIENLKTFSAEYGKYPNTDDVDFANHDVVFTLSGTTAGVVFTEFDRIPKDRAGLIIADATSYVLSKKIDWSKIDILTFSWQKCLGGEAQHGMMVLSPRAIERLENFNPNRAIPQLYRLKDYDNNLNYAILDGSPINTPSLLCSLDFMEALNWAENSGDLDFCIKKGEENFKIIESWVKESKWIDFLCEDSSKQSHFALCLKIIDKKYLSLTEQEQKSLMAKFFNYLNENKIAYDVESYKKAPLGIRIWAGVTVRSEDLKALTLWLDYCFYSLINNGSID